jgi:hypothetical protein
MREKIDFSERFLNTYTRITDVHRLKTGRQAGVATKDVFAQNIRLDRYERTDATAGLTAATLPTFWLIWQRLGHERQRISEEFAALAASPAPLLDHRIVITGGSPTSISMSDCPLRSTDGPRQSRAIDFRATRSREHVCDAHAFGRPCTLHLAPCTLTCEKQVTKNP